MTKNTFQTAAISSLLTFLALLGALGGVVSGMELSVEQSTLVLGCALMAIVFSFCWNSPIWLLPMCISALLLGYWWQEGSLRLSMEGLIYQISDLYDRGYGWGIVQWTDRNLLSEDTTAALLVVGLPIAGILSLTVAKGRFGWIGAGIALLPLFSCLILKDTVPAEEDLALLLFAVVLLCLTDKVRGKDPRQANRLTLALALPLALGLALLFTLCPQDTYNGQAGAQKLEDLVLQLLDRTDLPEGPALIPGDQNRTVDLEDVGKRTKDNDVIMTVRAQETGYIYLRGCAYDIYDGTSWSSTPGWNSWNLVYSTAGTEVKSLTVKTKQPHSVLYYTYTPYGREQKLLNGRIRNEDALTEYTVSYQTPVSYTEEWDSREDTIGGEQLEEYLQLPDSTRAQARDILTHRVGIPTKTNNVGQIWKNAQYIVQWVSRRGKYDLNTDKMPAGETDFAMWFLNQSKTGYCTHYATAAVVLLRAAGIPAQYVTGYLVPAKAGQTVTVTSANAHAWVEVFINGVGWVALEPTPGQGIGESSSDSSTEPDRPTGPNDTTEPENTTPSVTPDETTVPVETNVSTDPHQTETTPGQTTSVPVSQNQDQTGLANMGGASPGTPARQSFGRVLTGLLDGILALLAMVLQWRLRVWLTQSALDRGTPNRRALRRWKLLARMCRLTKTEPPEDCFWLAQKARFSQHTLTDAELDTLRQAIEDSKRQLKKRNFLLQLFYSLVLALY